MSYTTKLSDNGWKDGKSGETFTINLAKSYTKEEILEIIGPNADLTLLRQQGNREEYKKQYYINLEKDKIRGRL